MPLGRAIAAFLVCGGVGFWQAERSRSRAMQIRSLTQGYGRLCLLLGNGETALPEALQKAQAEDRCKQMFECMADQLLAGDGNIRTAWGKSLMDAMPQLTKEDTALALSMGEALCATKIEDFEKRSTTALTKMQDHAEKVLQTTRQNTKMSLQLGLIGGIGVGALLW